VNYFGIYKYKSAAATRLGFAEFSEPSQFCNDMPLSPQNVFPAGMSGN
jgi:hypothetical protein